MILFLFALIISISFSQTIQHDPVESSLSNQSIDFNIFIDNNGRDISKVSLMYKNINQLEYLSKDMMMVGNNNFICKIEDHFYDKANINYYFIVEFRDGGMISNPIQDSYLIDIIEYEDNYWDDIASNENADLLILSPLPESIIYDEDIIIAASMFSMNHIDVNNISIFIDGKDRTSKALINEDFISISKLYFSEGDHHVSINITNKFGMKYSPFEWSFTVKKKRKSWFNTNLNQNLKYWSSYSQSNIDQNEIQYYDHNLSYDIDLEWLKVKSDVKISSLEDEQEQSKNRYSLTLQNENVKLYLGDFYPYFNTYILNGSRVRGFNIESKYKFLSINLIKGELQRAVQGNPYDNAIYISDVDTINGIATISRDNYAFKRELTALKLGFQLSEKILWNVNLFKAKDNINSVYSSLPDANLEISEQYIDDFNYSYLNHMANDSTYVMTYKDFNLNYNDFLYNIDSINYLNNNWYGEKPKDNFIIGSEILFKLDQGRTQIHSEINLSMLNTNLWQSITNVTQLDTLDGPDLDGQIYGMEISEKIFEYNDIFQLGFDQIPIVPIDLTSDNLLNALFNMPSVIYEFDSKFNYGNHSIKYMYEKIGPQFNSLGNLYTQSNIMKESLSDRVRLFENRLYIYMDYTWQQEGLNLIEDNVTKTHSSTFSLSLYPGANLPNINIGFSNQDRFNDVPEAYFSEDSTIVSDTREHTYVSTYNFSISDRIFLLKEHDINFSMFISDKEDMLLKEKVALNNLYYSPRSYNENYSFNILTNLNDNWSSNLIYNISNFNNGNDNVDSLNYYQEQAITSLDLSLRYSGIPVLDKFKMGFNSISGVGYQNFIYYNLKFSANHKIFNAVKIVWNYDYQMKWIENDKMYRDSIFKMKLIYDL